MSDFTGDWNTTFGPMRVSQTGPAVHAVYQMPYGECTIEGTIKDGQLRFRYQEPNAAGEGWFVLQRYGKFSGQWRQDGTNHWLPWEGYRGFDGLWEATFGPLRLIQEADGIHGHYEGLGDSTIQGRLQGTRLTFRYQEPQARGEGWFELSPDGMAFDGQWRPEGSSAWQPWRGSRIRPAQRLLWLVVLEAYWQRGLGEKEYAFGNMLREFFARVPHVEVRQRFFNNGPGLLKWCRELRYLAEPVAVIFASHGTEEGLNVHGEIIRPEPLVEILRDLDNIRVLHFSSCLMMGQSASKDLAPYFGTRMPFPVSGYATSVDWAGSALIEFTYLDMILTRGLAPKAAADQITQLISFAGDKKNADSPYPPAMFRFWQPPAGGGGINVA
jgi:hypothetical protein